MKHAPKIAAVAYLLWGLVHVAGGGAMLRAALSDPDTFLSMLTGNETAVLMQARASGGDIALLSTNEVFAFHSFNIIWIGTVACVIAVRMNWKNSRIGYWFNMALVGFADVGLILFMIVPGVMDISDAWIGPLLFVIALVFSTLGRTGASRAQVATSAVRSEV